MVDAGRGRVRGSRSWAPGPACRLIGAIAGTLGLPVPAVGGLQQALGVAIGLASVALVHGRARGGRAGWVLVGPMAGIFAVHLAGGYVANLAFTATFLTAAAALARSRRGVIAAALLLGGGGCRTRSSSSPAPRSSSTAAAVSWVLEPEHGWRSDAGRVLAAVAGGGLVLGAGMLASFVGPARLSVDTSKDGFLRRAGLTDAPLPTTTSSASARSVRRFAPWVTLPLAAIGRAPGARLHEAVPARLGGLHARGRAPRHRHGVVPTGARHHVRVRPADPGRSGDDLDLGTDRAATVLTIVVTAVLLALFALPALNTQRHQTPFVSPEEIRRPRSRAASPRRCPPAPRWSSWSTTRTDS